MDKPRLLLGIDGGGSKTAVRVAEVDRHGKIEMLGEGFGGPSNVRSVGRAHAEINLNLAVDAALAAAGKAGDSISYAVLGLAGSSLPDVQSFIHRWADKRTLAAQIDIVHDAEPVLAAGTANAVGIALIVGTGSAVVGRRENGEQVVAGGWGHWFGDAGSGYDLGRRALAAVADATDGIGAQTVLVERILQQLQTNNPREMLMRLSNSGNMSRDIASLAPTLLHAAEEGDQRAMDIVIAAAAGPARLVSATAARLDFKKDLALAIAGGIVCANKLYREQLLTQLRARDIEPASVTVVEQPVAGCLRMAAERLQRADDEHET